MFRYVHTDIIAKDVNKIIAFYKKVLHCKSIGGERNLRGEWLDQMTGVTNAHIVGEHLLLPGYGEELPTLEIFSYDEVVKSGSPMINRQGWGHIAFEVDDVQETVKEVLANGGSTYGEIVKADYPNNIEATFVYVTDPEGNIIELQSWRKK